MALGLKMTSRISCWR